MHSTGFRPLTLAVLLLAISLLSGASLATTAPSASEPPPSCCFPASSEEGSAPCTTADCPCFFCLTLHPLHFSISRPTLACTVAAFALRQPDLPAFAPPIDYPPERTRQAALQS